jgi:putative CocE/NonD family hydrolase
LSVEVAETVWIPLADGCRLAARIWFPEKGGRPAPAILEYLPYRRRDRHRGDDAILHPALAEAGYVSVRVDMRGAGDSGGLMYDEYMPQEWVDAVEVIEWLSSQDWCDGNVGMMGISWSGFNSLQVASLAPPALKAIITTCASDDRFADDMHYMGGCLLNDNLQYGSTLFTWLATPPDPEVVGERWREMWLDRLNAVTPPALRWMKNPIRNDYWKSGSVCEDFSKIKAAVLAVGGWADGYSNSIMRLLAGLPGPSKGLIGPWAHSFPHVAKPGPTIDFIAYAVRWWDYWLRGIDNGIMDEPRLICWMQESEEPQSSFETRKGRFVAEACWPSARREIVLHAGESGLVDEPQALSRRLSSRPDVGVESGEWCPYGWGPDMPLDQREEDAWSVCFDTTPLDAAIQILGGVRVRLTLAAFAPEGIVAVRLNEIAADGSSRRITYGLRNLALADDFSDVRDMALGQPFDIDLTLNDIGYEVPAGHRLRLSISSAYWPLAVGIPGIAETELRAAYIRIPVRNDAVEASLPDLGEARRPEYGESHELMKPQRGRMSVTRDLAREDTVVEVVRNLGAVKLEDVGLTLRALGSETYSMPWRKAEQASAEARRLAGFERGNWSARVESTSRVTFAGDAYRFEGMLEAFDNGEKIFERKWDETTPRPRARIN